MKVTSIRTANWMDSALVGQSESHLAALQTRRSPRCAFLAVVLLSATAAFGASSLSYQIAGGAVDVSGGSSASTSHRMVACIGASIAGSSTSATYRIEAGCGVLATSTTSPSNPPPGPGPSIPLLNLTAATCGVNVWPPVVDLSSGDGPSFTANMVAILSSTLGMPLRFLEQTLCGTVTLSGFGAGKLAFLPHTFQTGDDRVNGVYPVGNGQYQLISNGQSLVLAPGVVHVEQLAGMFPGVAAAIADNGVISATLDGVTYVVQPDTTVVLEAATDSARLVLGTDGLWRFTDKAGNSQILFQAFMEPATLRSILQGMDPGASLSIQLDGTATIVLNATTYTLVPDITLGPIPADRVGQRWWQDGATRYRLVNVQGTGTSQGLSVRP